MEMTLPRGSPAVHTALLKIRRRGIPISKAIPRWEWRTFGTQFGEGEKKLARLDCSRVIEGEEIYILALPGSVNVKIRNGTLDIKELRAVNADKLEQWEPVFKETFPLDTSAVRAVFCRWQLPAPEMAEREYSCEEFLTDLIEPVDSLQTVPVTKKRYGYQLSGAILERADLVIDGRAIRTVCVEHHDPDLVLNLVRDFGFERYKNRNYVAAIRGILEGEVI